MTTCPRKKKPSGIVGGRHLILHPVTGRPTAYDILKSHPGDYFFPSLNPLETQRIKAKYIIHWFRKFRPGPGPRRAGFHAGPGPVLGYAASAGRSLQAQLSANLTAVFQTEPPPTTARRRRCPAPQRIPIDRGTATAAGRAMKPYHGNPGHHLQMFQEKCLGEAVRWPTRSISPWAHRRNSASSRAGPHQLPRRPWTWSGPTANEVVLDHIFRTWLEEAIIPGLLPARSGRWPTCRTRMALAGPSRRWTASPTPRRTMRQ